MKKMKCAVFIASTTAEKKLVNIRTLHHHFGINIPNYLQYEGGTGLNYLCCVDYLVDSKAICANYGYDYVHLGEIEINESLYSSEYTIYPTYSRDDPKYVLEKNKHSNLK